MAIANACSDGGKPAPPSEPRFESRRERRINLLARIATARIQTPEGTRPPRLQGDQARNVDVGALDCEVAPGSVLEFADVPLHPGATLTYECGARRTDAGGLPAGYRCRIRATDAQGVVTLLLDAPLAAAPSTERLRGELDLASLAPGPVRLAFEIEAPRGRDRVAWARLFVDSDGRAPAPDDRFLELEETVRDLAAEGSAEESARGVLAIGTQAVRDFAVELPERCALRFGLAPAAPLAASGQRLAIEVDGERLAEFPVDATRDAKRRELVDLARFAGRSVALRFVASSAPAAAGRAPVELIEPQLVAARSLLRLDRASRERDLFLIVVDTLRADALGCYGAVGDPTPQLDRLAQSGTLFEHALAPSSWTVPSTASLLTGLPVETHGVKGPASLFLFAGHETLAERLARRGYTTGAFVANTLISSDAQFDQGFETWQPLPWVNARKVARRAMQWVEEHPDERLFGYLHLVDPHAPYNAPLAASERAASSGNRYSGLDYRALLEAYEGIAEADFFTRAAAADGAVRDAVARARDLYADEVRYVDRWIGEFLACLARSGRLEDALIVVTADHGEEFLDHGRLFHGSHLYGESVRVPLIVHGPGAAAQRIAEHFGSRRLAALLESLAAEAQPLEELLVPHLARPIVLATEIATDGEQTGTRRAYVRGPMKLLLDEIDGRRELYDLRADPLEQHDLARLHPELADELAEELAQRLARQREHVATGWLPASDDALEQLRNLGYVR